MKLLYKSAPLIAFIIGIWYFSIRILGYHLEYIPGDKGDSRFINYLLEHGYKWATGSVESFWNAEFMYPFQHTIAISDSMLGTMPIYSIWRIIGFSPETSYQFWWICICALNYWCSFFVFKKWFNRSDIALILAWIFAFSLFNLGQLNYMQMIIRFMVPLVFYAAYKMVNAPSIKYLFFFCFGVAFQFYCAMYTGFYLMYFSLLFILIYAFVSKKWFEMTFYFKKNNLVYTSSIFIFSILAMLWLMVPYLSMSKILGLRLYREVIINLPLWNSFLFPHESSVTWRFLFNIAKPNVNGWWLQYLFTGIIPFIAMIISPFYLLRNWLKKYTTSSILKSLIITSIIIILLHLRTEGGLTLYALIFKFPGINSMRVLNRFMHVELFILLLICGYLLSKLKKKYFFPIIFLVFADNLFSTEFIPREKKAELIKRKENLLTELKMHKYESFKAAALIDTTQPAYITNLDMMLVSQIAGIKTVNGYSSSCPNDFGEFFNTNSKKGLFDWLASQKVNKEEILVIDINKK